MEVSNKNENLSEGELLKKAFAIGMRLKNSGLDRETIYARLEKEGIPEAIARQAIHDMIIQNRIDFVEQEAKPRVNEGLIRIGLG